MEYRELWPLLNQVIFEDIKTCCYTGCDAPISHYYHMWQNHTSVHVRLVCENGCCDWHKIELHTLYKYLPEGEAEGEGELGAEITT